MANRIFFTNRNQGTQADARRRENYKVVARAKKCYVWPTLFYRADTSSITKSLFFRLDAFAMWICRSVLKLSWTEKITNVEVLIRMVTIGETVRQFTKNKLQYLGHLMTLHITTKLRCNSCRIVCLHNEIAYWIIFTTAVLRCSRQTRHSESLEYASHT